jgi:dCMP deaminase
MLYSIVNLQITNMQEYIDKLISQNKLYILTDEAEKSAKKYLKIAYEYAKNNSDDNSTQTGCVAVIDNKIVSYGANCFSKGVIKNDKRLQVPLKYDILDHAERQCVYSAAKSGVSLLGSTFYTPWVPCSPCANAIISSGCSELILHYEKCIKTPNDWLISTSVSIEILLEANVKISFFKGKIGDTKNLFRGKIWHP